MANKKGQRARFGSLRKLPSRRVQARYTGPDGATHKAPFTFDTKTDAEEWLATVRADITRGDWKSPATAKADQARDRAAGMTFEDYSSPWLADRDVKPRTRALYESLLRVHLLPTFGALPLAAIHTTMVRTWHAGLTTGPTAKANAYGLLRTIMGDAVEDGLIPTSPVRVKRAGSKKRARELRVLTVAEFNTLVAAIPGRYRALVLLGGWCALRFGELAALRRCDLDLKNGLLHVREAVVIVNGETVVGSPKADSQRTVTIPAALLSALREHVMKFAAPGAKGLVFPAADREHHLAPSTLHRVWGPARIAAGRPDVRVHDLRHFGAIQAARAGATIGELQQRLGHSTASAAIIYQSAVSERPEEIASRLSAMIDAAGA